MKIHSVLGANRIMARNVWTRYRRSLIGQSAMLVQAAVPAYLKVQKGDAVFIRYEGPKGSGMPEMFYTSEAISSDKELGKSIALITDGRFSGASTGPVIRFLGENPGACPWDEAKKYFSKSLMSISSEYTLQI